MEKPEQFLSGLELKSLQDIVNKKGQKIQEIGTLTFQYHQLLGRLNFEVQEFQKEENALGKMLMSSKGLDIEKENYSIDLTTGKITKSGKD